MSKGKKGIILHWEAMEVVLYCRQVIKLVILKKNSCNPKLSLADNLQASSPPSLGVGIPVYVDSPNFDTDVVGVHIGMLGFLLLAVRIFDAVTDPFLGYLSDWTRTPFGRRRPYIALG
jgi:hypothetical protein